MEMLAFRTLGKRWLLSLTSLPPGETRAREQAAEIPFFRSLARGLKYTARAFSQCHQTGWTGLVAIFIQLYGLLDPKRFLKGGREAGFKDRAQGGVALDSR